MRLGLALPVSALGGGPLKAGSIAETASLAEQLGYESFWVFDAVGRGFMLPDPLMALAVAAAVTERIELGAGILQLPIRNPAEVAHRALTLHLVASGRAILGIGPGSTKADFDTFGADFGSRFQRFDGQRRELESWLRTGANDGRTLSPWPTTGGGPPVFYAGWNGPWVERAAKQADGWIASAANADDVTLADALARYRQAGGRRAVVTNLQMGTDVGPGLERLHHLAGLGFDDIVVMDLAATEERLALVRDAAPTDSQA